MNQLYYGDNLTIMRKTLRKHSVDLIYLDPPFKSQQNYNLIYKQMTGKPVPEQAEAFCDTWDMDAEKQELAKRMPILLREHGIEDYYIEFWRLWVTALRKTQSHLLAYLIYMVERLLEMKVILKPSGSIYLHCDPTASHYIKVMMDGIFGHNNFRNEIIWKRTSSHSSAKRWGPVHDVILYYSASDKYTWNRVAQQYDETYIESFYRHVDDDGRRFRLGDLTGAGKRDGDSGKPWRDVDPTLANRHWAVPAVPGKSQSEIKSLTVQQRLDALEALGLIYWPKRGSVPQFKRYLEPEKGVAIQDVVTDIDPLSPHAKERLGYQTQKPIELLDRIIRASTNKGDVVFDPFCGCGTTIYAAETSGRSWIGCDIAILAVRLVRQKLVEDYKLVEGVHFSVDGIPVGVEQAEELFRKDPFQFQHWAVECAKGFPSQKRSGDQGVDGRLYFETQDGLRQMVLSVKGGGIRPTDVRDLIGVLDSEPTAELAGFISLREPSKAMRDAASKVGSYRYNGIDYDRVQFLTVAEMLEGKQQFHTPTKVGARIATGQTSLLPATRLKVRKKASNG